MLEGQVHGGIAQGAGQALLERAVYDADGQLLTASLMDYAAPRADDLPGFAFETRNVPSTANPLGLKGRGRGRQHRFDPGRDERRRRRPLARLRDRPHRHAGDAVRGVQGDPQGAGRTIGAIADALIASPPDASLPCYSLPTGRIAPRRARNFRQNDGFSDA